LSTHILSTSDQIAAIVTQYFYPLPNQHDKEFYPKFQLRIKQLQHVLDLLDCLPTIEETLAFCHSKHNHLLSGVTIATVLSNLQCLRKHVLGIKVDLESTLFHMLDACPTNTAKVLKSMMKLVRILENFNSLILIQLQAVKSWKVKLTYITPGNFETIGVRRWLNDEVINYFVNKWCSRSQATLGFNTFFACKFLFQKSSCINARSGDLTSEDVKGVQKWCRAAQVRHLIKSLRDLSDLRVEGPGPRVLGIGVHPNQ
jgi:hypothetical protein